MPTLSIRLQRVIKNYAASWIIDLLISLKTERKVRGGGGVNFLLGRQWKLLIKQMLKFSTTIKRFARKTYSSINYYKARKREEHNPLSFV